MIEEDVLGKAYDSKLMRRLLAFAAPYKTMLIGSVLLLLTAQGFSAYRPKLIQEAIDKAIVSNNPAELRYYATLFILLLVGEFLLQYGVIYVTQLMGQKIVYDLRVKLYAHLEHLHLQFFDRNPVGRLITRVTSDIESLNEMFTSGLVYLFGDIFLLLGIVIFMFTMDVRMALVTLAVVPAIFYISVIFKSKVRVVFREVRLKISSLNAFVQENITGVLTVQIFNREKKHFEKFDELNSSLTKSHIDSVFHYAWFYPVIQFLSSIATALLVWYGGGEVIQKAVSLGTLIAFVEYARLFFRPIQDLSDKYNILQTAMASSERVFKVLDTKSVIETSANPVRKSHCEGRISFRHVDFAYDYRADLEDQNLILKDVSFDVDPGQSIALVGATGAGKSTIINLVSRFYDIQRGEILVDGVRVTDWDPYALRSHIAVVLQDVFLFSGSVLDNIRLGREDISPADVEHAARLVGADRFIQKLPLTYHEPMQERGSTLSVGQRQLISLARALVFDPKILVLDEATSSIDTETEQLLQEGIRTVMKGRTSLVIAHRLSTIRNADKILVMHKGRIREQGTHEELLDRGGLYFKLYQLQYRDQEVRAVASASTGSFSSGVSE
ncbi:MAG: ABC transporter ATP-binding protein [Bacteroidetes bacterium]|nr:ABC transporter ATP-binding protein [Bacteroidota bacterium]